MYRGILTLLVGLMLSLGESVEVNASKGDGSLVQGQPEFRIGPFTIETVPNHFIQIMACDYGTGHQSIPNLQPPKSQEAFLVELLRRGLSCYPVDEKKDEVEIGLK